MLCFEHTIYSGFQVMFVSRVQLIVKPIIYKRLTPIYLRLRLSQSHKDQGVRVNICQNCCRKYIEIHLFNVSN